MQAKNDIFGQNDQSPTTGEKSAPQAPKDVPRPLGGTACSPSVNDDIGELVEMTINKVKRGSGKIMSDPHELLEFVLSEAESLNPNQNLALQIACGPLDSFGDSIPPWFGSCERRRAHYSRNDTKPEKPYHPSPAKSFPGTTPNLSSTLFSRKI